MNAPVNAAPTSEELLDGAASVISEAHAALSTDRFAIINVRTPSTVRRYYGAAAVRHRAGLFGAATPVTDGAQPATAA